MPRTKQQNEIIRNRRKDVIVNAAIRVFATLPYNEVTMSAIAREAKCGHSLIYHYFDNIRDLYDSAIEKNHSFFLSNYGFYKASQPKS